MSSIVSIITAILAFLNQILDLLSLFGSLA